MRFLRQSTASQEILLGPFVAAADGTAQTGLTIANTDIKLLYAGGTSETNKNSGGGTHIAGGRYSAVLDATDTATVGILEVSVNATSGIPWNKSYYVLEEEVFDDFFAASAVGYLKPTTAGRDLDVTTTGEAGLDLANVNFPVGALPFLAIVDNGTCQAGGSTTTAVIRAASAFGTNVLAGKTIWFISGTNAGYCSVITSNVTATDTVTFSPAVGASTDATDVYVIFSTPPFSATTLPTVDVTKWNGTAVASPATAGIPTVRFAAAGVADILTTALTEAYAADGAAGTLSQILFGLQAFLQERSVSATTVTSKKLDGSTTAMTFTINDGTTPTSITRAS
jgi:hypothetical protein